MRCSNCKEDGHNKRSCPKLITSEKPKIDTPPNPTPTPIPKRKKPQVAKMSLKIVCPVAVVEGKLITKEKRHEVFGQVAGGAGSRAPELFQRKMIIEGTGIDCPKTNTRINLRTNTLKDISHPNTSKDGFDYSEDFDGCQTVGNDKKVYVNLKCIVGAGGAQTRSLREVYWFVEGQLNTLKKVDNVYFANILDGDEAADSFDKFEYILSLAEFESVKNRIYVGDLKGYFDWFKKTFA